MANEILTPAWHYISGANLPTGVTEAEQFLPASAQATAVADALSRLGQDVPRLLRVTFPGAGAASCDLSTLAGYVEGVSVVTEVSYPWVLGQDNRLEYSSWDVLIDPVNGESLYLYGRVVATGSDCLVTFTAPWTEAAVPSHIKYKIAKLAAANMARMVAARMAQSHDSTINVDTFGRNAAAGDWARIAKDLEAEYRSGLGIGNEAQVRAAWGETQLLPLTGTGYDKVHPYPPSET